MLLSTALLIFVIFVAVVCADALTGRALLLGLLFRRLAQTFKRQSPEAARRAGLGDEVVQKLGTNEGTAALLGHVCTVEVTIKNGAGRVLIGGTSWAAEGPDMPAGMLARVVSAEGNRVIVERHAPES